MRILLVEDDELLAQGIKTALSHFDYMVDWVKKGSEVLQVMKSTHFTLLILDLGLPDIDGVSVLKSLRDANILVPVLVLTARDQIDDKVLGLNAGADDYMVKPFDIKELEARIRTLTRRATGRRIDIVQVGRAGLDLCRRILVIDDKVLTFSRREFALVQAFFEHPHQIFSREALESRLYGWDDEIESNSLEVHIHRLRKKLGSKAIKTVRGVGYMLVEEQFV